MDEPLLELPDVLTPAEVGEVFGVHPQTVWRWARAGKLAAFVTLGGHRRYHRADVEAALRDHADRDTAAPERDTTRAEA
jgi:excisionase family DNA binding protein